MFVSIYLKRPSEKTFRHHAFVCNLPAAGSLERHFTFSNSCARLLRLVCPPFTVKTEAYKPPTSPYCLHCFMVCSHWAKSVDWKNPLSSSKSDEGRQLPDEPVAVLQEHTLEIKCWLPTVLSYCCLYFFFHLFHFIFV